METRNSEIFGGKIRFHSVHTDRFKMSRFSINFITKSDKIHTPLYKLMLSVMLRGSEKYPTITDINKALDERYGATVSFRSARIGEKSIFKISCKVLKERYVFEGDETRILDEVIAIISDILMNPVKDEDGLLLSSYVESEKRIAVDAINAKINDPKSYASEQCSKKMFEGSEYELHGGSAELINSFTAKELTEGIQQFFDQCVIECYYIGNESHEYVSELVKRSFALSDVIKDIPYIERPFERRGEVKYIEEEKEVSQGRLVLGYRCSTVLADGSYYAMALFNEIFGGGSVSKLFMNVRERKSLCYYCYSSLHSATGTIKVGCGIDTQKKDEAMLEIARQLDAMKCGDITDSELETAKRALISGLRQIKDSPSSIEADLLRKMLGGIERDFSETVQKIEDITCEDVAAAAKKVELDTVYFMKGTCEDEVEYDEE